MEHRMNTDLFRILRWASDNIAKARERDMFYESAGRPYEMAKEIGKREAYVELHRLIHEILAEQDGDPLHDYMMGVKNNEF